MTINTINEFPTPTPNRSQVQAVFSAAMDTWMAYFPTFETEWNVIVGQLNTDIAAAIAAAGAASDFVDEAEGFRNEAQTFRNQSETFRNQAETFRNEAEGFKDDAETAAATAATLAQAYQGTSTTSIAMTVGSKSISTQINKSWLPQDRIRLVHDVSNYHDGYVDAYDSATGAMTFISESFVGAGGPYNSWTLNLSGQRGATGPAGGGLPTLDVTGSVTATVGRNHHIKAAADVTLPTAPTQGDRVGGVKMTFGAVNIISNKPINGNAAGTFPWLRKGSSFDLTFDDNTDGWVTT